MINLKEIYNRNRKLIISLLVIIIAISIGILVFDISKDDLIDFLFLLLGPYIRLAEVISSGFIHALTDGVSIVEHKLVFDNYKDYYIENQEVIDNWPSYLLYLKWTAFILITVWLFSKSLKTKLLYSFFLVVVHFFAVVSGLVLIAGIGPRIIDPDSLTELRPHTIGSLALFGLFVLWLRANWFSILEKLAGIGIKLKLDMKKRNEVLLLALLFILIKNFFVPYFNYYAYIDFLLTATDKFVALFGYDPLISTPYLIGKNGGTLYMAKWCLGFVTMFVFAALVYLTRINNRVALLYIFAGVVFLHLINIVRLSVLFIFVQTHSSIDLIMDHHDLYNIVVYIIIFILWVVWNEKFLKPVRKDR